MKNQPSQEDRLRTRLFVIFLGIPGLTAIIWLGGWLYVLFVAVVVGLGLREYLRLLRGGGLVPRPIPAYLAALALLVAASYHVELFGRNHSGETLGIHFLSIIVLLIITLQITEVLLPTKTSWMNVAVNLLGVVWVAVFASSFILVRLADFGHLHYQGDVAFRLTMSLFIAVWVCDALAYLFGKRFGKRKILPQVSPKKTVVGTVAGQIGAILTIILLGVLGLLPMQIFPVHHLLVLGLITGGAGQMGDFVESRLKRDFNVKDTGALLPGHGGVLDRFDSLFFVMPLTYLFLLLTKLL